MEIVFFFKGLLVGILIAAPVGPVGTLCVQRTFTEGRLNGFISGMGATTADVIFGFIAAFGLTVISNFLIEQQEWLRLVGGLFVSFLGIKILFLNPKNRHIDRPSGRSFLKSFLSAFVMTITNPITILTLALMFAGLGLVVQNAQFGAASLMVFGVFIGSSIIWLALWGLTVTFREKFSLSKMAVVNKVAGMIIIIFGMLSLLSLL